MKSKVVKIGFDRYFSKLESEIEHERAPDTFRHWWNYKGSVFHAARPDLDPPRM